MIEILRIGHRISRDKRITTHVALVARAFGAKKIYIDRKDTNLEKNIKKICDNFEGDFQIITEVNKKVTGSAKVKLFKGSAEVVARESPNGLYDLNLATYDTDSTFNQRLSYGFIPLFGLQSKMGFLIKKKLEEEKK